MVNGKKLYRTIKFWRYLVVVPFIVSALHSLPINLMHYQVPLGCPSATMRKWVSTSVIYSTNKPETRRDELSKYTIYLYTTYEYTRAFSMFVRVECGASQRIYVNLILGFRHNWFFGYIIYSSVFSLMAKSKFKVRGRGRCLISTRGFMYMQATDR